MMKDPMTTTNEAQVITSIAPAKMTLASAREQLAGKTGRRFWKNLDELAETAEFQEMVAEEFPRQAGAGEWVDAVSRRGFLKVMGASFALAGLAGCTKQPDEPIYPYVKQPEDLVFGKPMYFATAYPFATGAIPILVKSDAFRPIKIEGNPDHPMSKGKSDAYSQGTLLDLYDPDRSQHPVYRGETSEFGYFQQMFATAAKKMQGGAGLYFLSETITSPTLAAQWRQVQAAYPQAKLVQWDPINQDSSRAASKAAFGSYTDAQYRLENADVIVSLDADFLGGIGHPGFLPMASAYAEGHRYEEDKPMNRLYVVETMPTVTGFKAEHRLALKPSEVSAFATLLAGGSATQPSSPEAHAFLVALQKDLQACKGRCVVIPGEHAAPAVHLAAYRLNQNLGAVGKTVVYTEPINPMPSEQAADFRGLIDDINAGKVQWLVMLGTNPVYSAPADYDFQDTLNKVPFSVHLGSHLDETGLLSTWHLNKAHYLESWTDARAYDGQISIVQPMIDPLYQGVSAHNVLQCLLENAQLSAFDVVQANAKTYIKGDFAAGWSKALHDGWVQDTALAPKAVSFSSSIPETAIAPSAAGLEVSFRHDPSLYDGRFANVGWLQELPKQITSMSWDNAALMSLATLERLNIAENEAIELQLGGRKVIAPVLGVPGHADDAVTIYLGHGRSAAGRVGSGVGFNATRYARATVPCRPVV